jgi:histidinol-phosphate phosphatase family protein
VSTIFLDRDGVINENRADYVKSWSEFSFLPGSREAIAKLTQAGHRIVVCTNQAGVARGDISKKTVEEIHHRMVTSIGEVGGKIEKVYYCPHAKDEGCACRKPRPGMLLQARDELGLDMHDAVFIGDSITDVRAGIAAGIHSVLVLSGLGLEQFRDHHQEVNGQFRISMNLKHATELVLQGLHVSTGIPSSLERACYAFLGLNERVDSRKLLEEYDLVEASLAL